MSKKIGKYKYILYTLTLIGALVFSFYFTSSHLSKNTSFGMNNLNKDLNTKPEIIINDEYILKEKMIIADLKNMNIKLYDENGLEVENINIVSKGKPNSYYETPTGDYKIIYKDKNKFSSLGEVYMPYAMQFYGNFFIHGIPYHTDGTRVSSSYSGGCIRLADDDAKKVFEFSQKGTRLLILTNEATENNIDLGEDTSKRMMNVLVGLEVINQEKYIYYNGKEMQIKNLNKHILTGDTKAENILISQIGGKMYNEKIKEKADAMYITADFSNIENRKKLYDYIKANKSYILTLM